MTVEVLKALAFTAGALTGYALATITYHAAKEFFKTAHHQ